jgi:hypothetical protein
MRPTGAAGSGGSRSATSGAQYTCSHTYCVCACEYYKMYIPCSPINSPWALTEELQLNLKCAIWVAQLQLLYIPKQRE